MMPAAKPIAGTTGRGHPASGPPGLTSNPLPPMLRWAVIFLVLGLVAAVLGFTSIAGAAIGAAKILFYIFLVLFVVALLFGMTRGGGRARR